MDEGFFFLLGRAIKVRIGNSYSEKFVIKNGTPQGSIASPLLFAMMIYDVFEDLDNGLGFSLFADDGAIWKRGRNIDFIVKKKKKKLQEAITKVEEWSYRWGFKFSVDKTKIMIFFFTRKKNWRCGQIKMI